MIELNGIYKLKKIKGVADDNCDYQVMAIKNVSGKDTAYCKNLRLESFQPLPQWLLYP